MTNGLQDLQLYKANIDMLICLGVVYKLAVRVPCKNDPIVIKNDYTY